jgi:L-2-hydroxyglutarate oxidase LhgO
MYDSAGKYDFIIIGGGIVGLAAANKISERYPEKTILVLEKEEKIACHQTGHNSGVIHSGLYYKPGSYKARNCVNGRKELIAFAKKHHVPHDICGKVVVATRESELPHIDSLYKNGTINGLVGIQKINARQIRDIEPECRGVGGLFVPETGIINFTDVSYKFIEIIRSRNQNNQVFVSSPVTDIENRENEIRIITATNRYTCSHLISCAGLQADRIAGLQGIKPEMRIVPFRGDYFKLREKAYHKVRNLIYPVPDPRFPFLGVHFTRMISGGMECGPNAVFAFKREGYNKTDFSLGDTFDSLIYPGFIKFGIRHLGYGLSEYLRTFSKRLFYLGLRRLVPSLKMEDLIPARSGVRAMAVDSQGNMIDDFKIEYGANSIHVLNAPSPAATASLAIGARILEMAREYFRLE